jgi:hypothetical protein
MIEIRPYQNITQKLKKIKYLLGIVLFIFFLNNAIAQEKQYAKDIIDTLCSPHMHGRGYVKNGDSLAANFISNEYKAFGLKPFNDSYYQYFRFPINTFPDTVDFYVDNKKLIPGKEYYISADAKSIQGCFETFSCKNIQSIKKCYSENVEEKFIIIDKKFADTISQNPPLNAKGAIFLAGENLYWYISNGLRTTGFIKIYADSNKIDKTAKEICLHIDSKFHHYYTSQNVVGFVKGKRKPDSLIIFSAHYDHLGRMGNNVYFPGANDNASGVAMLLNLARYYSKKENHPDYSIAFCAFSAEEAGLIGSSYYTENPLFPLDHTRFVINLDLVGTGSEGIKVVNGAVLTNEFSMLVNINNKKQYLSKISKRGEAANSDHYPFYRKGVKSFFIYTLGGSSAYHNMDDRPETLPLTKFEELFNLLIDFAKVLQVE